MINEFKNPDLKSAVHSIMEVGVEVMVFANFATLLSEMDEKAHNGDAAAAEILARVIGVGKLIRYASRCPGGA